ncbi:hypothetical protein LCGC14_0224790 [marine sediment metagenome]|uniref:Uncharacterized protein n=1 Tax=marine sediment metagenome TaxID=412755 RepID=A0A0F9UCJ1_9ZZZZ|nr:hypothetical protein [bacterium]
MRAKDFFEWLVNELVLIEFSKHPKGKEARFASRFANTLYQHLSDREKVLVDNILIRISKRIDNISSEETGQIRGAISIVRKYI